MPSFNDTYTATRFYTSLTSLVRPGRALVPMHVDERMLVTIGANLAACQAACQADQPKCQKFAVAASMNNQSFKFPTKTSLLEAQFKGTVGGVYTADFPDRPPVRFDYTNPAVNNDLSMIFAPKSTKVKRVRYNATVEMVLQNTAIIGIESHPMHLHGFNFFVLAQGFGNYNEGRDWRKFNLWNPQERNTIAVPPGGWAVIRFRADNPGQWLMHCHLDLHLSWGLAMVFQVDNGPDPSSTLPPPPPDYPKCY
ncbi:uncharacterized protein A4U43_C07F17480 [Asparagus officinalis]|uniref:Plastocyanin-like domain-containing protein n=2 Tax=Asparagus officinalis TaxID=4686 RepID=A0A5P1ECT4_ASPOF|nr:uncharacterized protein A4U43_C07F17480 [Asparagus officinalis]